MRINLGRFPVVSRLWLVLLLLFAACASVPPHGDRQSPGNAATTIIVVRHAEQVEGAGEDPPLRDEGLRRAEALAEAVAGAGVDAVYVTQYQRTQQTARPVAARAALAATVFPADRSDDRGYATALAREILAKHRGDAVVVISHSNTVPLIVEALSGKPVPPIGRREYDRLYIVAVPASGPARLIEARYGARNGS